MVSKHIRINVLSVPQAERAGDPQLGILQVKYVPIQAVELEKVVLRDAGQAPSLFFDFRLLFAADTLCGGGHTCTV